MADSMQGGHGAHHRDLPRSRSKFRRLESSLVALVAVTCAAGLSASVAPVGASTVIATGFLDSRLVAFGSVAHIPTGAKPIGRLSESKSIKIDVALKPRNAVALSLYAGSVNTTSSPNFHHYLSPAQFASHFGASQQTVGAISSWLQSSGLHVGALSANRLVLTVQASAAAISTAFHTSLAAYQLKNGKLGWAAESAPLVPSLATSSIASIVGLNNLVASTAPVERNVVRSNTQTTSELATNAANSHATTATPQACKEAAQSASQESGWTDTNIAQAYGLTNLFAKGDVGQGQTIALFELEPFANSDIVGFDDCYFGESHLSQITRVPVDGFNLTGAGSGEAALDVEDLSALAPAAKIAVYEAPNTTAGDLDEYNAIIGQDKANIVSSSWGECEYALQVSAPGAQQVENTLFEEAAVQGQTVLAAAGDDGSDDCANTPFGSSKPAAPLLSVDDPGSQPFVISVGGSSLQSIAAPTPTSEVVWNDGASGGSTGGGFSNTWPTPVWQSQSGVPGAPTSGYRAVPDISASADEQKGITVFSQLFGGPNVKGAALGAWSTLGGTSSATPIWAAILADIATSGGSCASLPTTAGGTDLGFISPELYAAASLNYSQTFHDLTSGNNDTFRLGAGYNAGPGFDEATGLGTPIVSGAGGVGGLAASLCTVATGTSTTVTRPAVSSLTPSFGPATGGTTVTIGGSGFPALASTRVSFDGVNAQVLSATPTAITAVAPTAIIGAGTAAFAGAGPAVVSVTSVSTVGSATSIPVIFDYVNENAVASAVPTVTGIGPSGGSSTSNIPVTIFGSGFASAGTPTVTVGGVSALSVQVVNDFQLRVVLPPKTGATVCTGGAGFTATTVCQTQVVVANANGSNPLATIVPPYVGPITFSPAGVIIAKPGTEIAPVATEFDYSPKPTITAIRPNPADPRGTKPVVIHGRGFSISNLAWVNFGPARNSASEQVKILAITPTSITIDPPPSNVSVDTAKRRLPGGVSVQTSAGLSNVAAFFYSGKPTVARLSVLGAPTTTTTKLTVYGSNLDGVNRVAIEDALAPNLFSATIVTKVSDDSGNQFTIVLPKHHAGPYEIVPCTPSGCPSADIPVQTLVYFNPLSSDAQLSIHDGPSAGGAAIYLFGEGIAKATTAIFGSKEVAVHSASQFPPGDQFVAEVTEPAGKVGEKVSVNILGVGGRGPQPAGNFLYVGGADAKKGQAGLSGLN